MVHVAHHRVRPGSLLKANLPLGDGQELRLAVVGATRRVAEVADELRDEDVPLARAHPVDVRRERVVVADGDPLREALVVADAVEAVRPAELGATGMANEIGERVLLRAPDVLEHAIPRPHPDERGRPESVPHDARVRRENERPVGHARARIRGAA